VRYRGVNELNRRITILAVVAVAVLGIAVGVTIDRVRVNPTVIAASGTTDTGSATHRAGWFTASCDDLQHRINADINASDLIDETTAANLLTIYYHNGCP
jgi:hypothetical protein